jgi:hypothetical protein
MGTPPNNPLFWSPPGQSKLAGAVARAQTRLLAREINAAAVLSDDRSGRRTERARLAINDQQADHRNCFKGEV